MHAKAIFGRSRQRDEFTRMYLRRWNLLRYIRMESGDPNKLVPDLSRSETQTTEVLFCTANTVKLLYLRHIHTFYTRCGGRCSRSSLAVSSASAANDRLCSSVLPLLLPALLSSPCSLPESLSSSPPLGAAHPPPRALSGLSSPRYDSKSSRCVACSLRAYYLYPTCGRFAPCALH